MDDHLLPGLHGADTIRVVLMFMSIQARVAFHGAHAGEGAGTVRPLLLIFSSTLGILSLATEVARNDARHGCGCLREALVDSVQVECLVRSVAGLQSL